jgi:hypothetical protein
MDSSIQLQDTTVENTTPTSRVNRQNVSTGKIFLRSCPSLRWPFPPSRCFTARIRRARTGKDPAGQLSSLYEKTQDAMVAFELARHFETAGLNTDAGKWYATAAQRFRRADWKTKASESAVRLGVAVSAAVSAMPTASPDSPQQESMVLEAPAFMLTMPGPGLPFEQNAQLFESVVALSSEVQAATDGKPSASASASEAAGSKRRRRGRRGGRNRRKPAAGAVDTPTGDVASLPPSLAPSAASANFSRREPARGSSRAGHSSTRRPSAHTADEPAPAIAARRPVPPLPVDLPAELSGPSVKGRYGDPGLSSRLSLLEMQFRRLLTCEPAKLDDTVLAPVGPGVFLLSDSDLTSYYYVEACQTLRIAIGNLLRGGSSRRGAESIKPQLAEHLGIAETRVAKYLADHCVVRWLQLDDNASHFAHFVIAVLRPVLNE